MPDEQFGEVIRDFEATFFDVSDQCHQVPLQQSLQQIHIESNKPSVTASLLMNDPETIAKM